MSERVHALALRAYDRMVGLELDDLAVDGCVTKAPGGGEAAGRSPVDRGKQGLKRSVVTDGAGIPLHVVAARANWHDAPLLGPTLAGLDKLDGLPDAVTVHLGRGYGGGPTRALLDALGVDGAIARKGVPAPVQASARWVLERTQPHHPGNADVDRWWSCCDDRDDWAAAAVRGGQADPGGPRVTARGRGPAMSDHQWSPRPPARRGRRAPSMGGSAAA